jgi:diacylglycerol kinase family enzyme
LRRVWLIENASSGSATAPARAAVAAALSQAGCTIVGRTDFPRGAQPGPALLNAAGADTAVIHAGDGTINAMVHALNRWGGAALVLPGGTMNLLAKRLHGDRPAAAIVARAASAGAAPLPAVMVEDHCALVGAIAGPAAAWVHPREAVRRSARLAGLWRALRLAIGKTLRRGVRLLGKDTPAGRYQAVNIRALDETLEIAAIATLSLKSAAELGWRALTGDWRDAQAVTVLHATTVALGGKRSLTVLIDGERRQFVCPVAFSHGHTRLRFIATR